MKKLILPHLRQTYNYDCGACALQAVFAYYGLDVNEGRIIKEAKTEKKDGTRIKRMVKTAEKHGLKTISKPMSIKEVKRFIDRKIPVIMVLQAWNEDDKKVNWEKDWKDGHYVVAIGYTKCKVLFEDPASFENVYLKYDELKKRWHDIDGDGKKYYHHGIAIYGKKPKFDRNRIVHMD